MLNLLPEVSCFVKIYACSFYKNFVYGMYNTSTLFIISIVKIIEVEECCNNLLKPNTYSIFVPDEPHVKPIVNEKLWVSSKNLLLCNFLNNGQIDTNLMGNELLRIMIWYISWNRVIETSTSTINNLNTIPFQVCVFTPNLLLGCIISYPYLVKQFPVTLVLCTNIEFDRKELGVEERYLELVNIVKLSDIYSTTIQLLDYTQNLGFNTVLIGPNIDIEEEILIRLALGSVSTNGNIILSRQVEQLNSFECSILFQKKCTLSFSNPHSSPINFISSLVDKYAPIDNNPNVFNTILSEINVNGERVTKIENQIAYCLISNSLN
ncbi:hypothetical protein HWI79_2243 [Cryptosporidium felis]|nr:hypothetical protein HWI79_2243 [Cryptosporidium felis]